MWQIAAIFYDMPSAQAFAERLAAEGVPAKVISDSALLGEARGCNVVVPEELAPRARLLMAQSEISEEELSRIAASEPREDEADGTPS